MKKLAGPVCLSVYSSYKAFSKHMIKHKERGQLIPMEIVEYLETEKDDSCSSNNDSHQENDHLPSEKSETGNDQIRGNFSERWNILRKNEIVFALKMSSKYGLPNHVVSDIVDQIEEQHSSKLDILFDILKSHGHENAIQILRSANTALNNVDEISTYQRRCKAFKAMFDFIIPQRISICQEGKRERFLLLCSIRRVIAPSDEG